MKYIILTLLLTTSLFGADLSEIGETSFVVTYEEDEDKNNSEVIIITLQETLDINEVQAILPKEEVPQLKDKIDISKLEPKGKYYILGQNKNLRKFEVNGIKPYSKFTIFGFEKKGTEYSFIWRISSTTNASEPKESPSGIIFKNTDTNRISVTWKDAPDSDGTLLLVSKDNTVSPPLDFTSYTPSNKFGTDYSYVNEGTYAVFSGKNQNQKFIDLENLEFGTYHFQAFSYNGDYSSINYNTKPNSNNPRSVQTKLRPPILDDDADFEDDIFEIVWNEVDGAESYELQAAYDKDFKDIIKNYDIVDVGNITTFAIFMEYPDKAHFVRIRAKQGRNLSDWSIIREYED